MLWVISPIVTKAANICSETSGLELCVLPVVLSIVLSEVLRNIIPTSTKVIGRKRRLLRLSLIHIWREPPIIERVFDRG